MPDTSVTMATQQHASNTASPMAMASALSCGTSGGEPFASVASSERLHNRKFGFEARASHNARVELMHMRDKNFRIRPASVENDIWKRPPPDFRRQCFEPKPPKRNSREAMKPWRYGPLPAQLRAEAEAAKAAARDKVAPPDFMNPPIEKEADGFDLTYHVPDTGEARADFVTNGMNKPEPYVNPHLHDYRQYSSMKELGLPKFQTIFDADPFNLKFHSERLGIIHGLSRGVPPERNIKGRQMAPPLHQPAKWEACLHLTSDPWPTPAAQYSRFRPFWRSPHTVLMDRMEESLASKWATEKHVSPAKAASHTLVQSKHS